MASEQDAVRHIAGRVSEALDAADLEQFADLLDPDVQWGPPGDPAPPCQNREQVLSWYRRGRESGVRGRVTETVVAGDQILVGLSVTGRQEARDDAEAHDRWQVLTVRDGRVAAIVGFDDRDEAAAWAGIRDEPARSLSAIWVPPLQPLADDSRQVPNHL